MAVTPDRIKLVIEELVLVNMKIQDGVAFKSAIESQLGHLISQQGVSESMLNNSMNQDSVNTKMKLATGREPDRMAVRIAEAIYGSLSK